MTIDGKRLAEQAWTAATVKERLEEAAATLKALPMPKGGRPAGHRVAWPEMVQSVWEAYNGLSEFEIHERQRDLNAQKTRVTPTAEQITRMDEALDWLYYIKQPLHRRVVFARAMGVGATKLARELDVHRNTIGNWYEHGIERILISMNRRL